MLQDYILTDDILFNPKPTAVPYNYRISYKIPQILLILSLCCSRGGCSLIKLQMIATALSDDDEIRELISFSKGLETSIPVVRFDPSVNRGLIYALAEGLVVQQKDGKLKLTLKGKQYVSKILEQDNLMSREIYFLNELSTNITEAKIKEIMSGWRYQNATS